MQPFTRCTWASFSTVVFSPLPYQKISGTFFPFSKTHYTNNLHYAPAVSKIFVNSILISCWSYPHSDLHSRSTTTHYFQTLRIVCGERQLKYLLNKFKEQSASLKIQKSSPLKWSCEQVQREWMMLMTSPWVEALRERGPVATSRVTTWKR